MMEQKHKLTSDEQLSAFGSIAGRIALKMRPAPQKLAMGLEALANKNFHLAGKWLDMLASGPMPKGENSLLHHLASAFDRDDTSVAEFAGRYAQELQSQINARGISGQTPLHVACCSSNWRFAQILIGLGADPNPLDSANRTPLYAFFHRRKSDFYAGTQNDDLKTIQALLDGGARCDLVDDSGLDALFLAVRSGQASWTKAVLERRKQAGPAGSAGRQTRVQLIRYALSHPPGRACLQTLFEGYGNAASEIEDPEVWTAAAEANDPNALAALDAFAQSRNIAPKFNSEALQAAISNGNEKLAARIARQHGLANATVKADGVPMSALAFAAFKRQPACAKALIEAGADPNARLQATADEIAAAVRSMTHKVHPILNPHSFCAPGMTPLMAACLAKDPHSADEILKAGADLGAQDQDGKNALAYAIRFDSDSCAALLLERASPAQRDALLSKDKSPLGPVATAIGCNAEKTTALLCKEGFDPDARDANGDTALLLASDRCTHGVVKALIDHGCKIYAEDRNGRTPMDRAKMRENHGAMAAIGSACAALPPGDPRMRRATRPRSTNLFCDEPDDIGSRLDEPACQAIQGAAPPISAAEWNSFIQNREADLRSQYAETLAAAFGPQGIPFLALSGLARAPQMNLQEAHALCASLLAPEGQPIAYKDFSADRLRDACAGLAVLQDALGFSGPAAAASHRRRNPGF